MNVCGRELRVQGRLIRIASLAADGFEFLDDPDAALGTLRRSGTRIDLFSFTRELPETSQKYAFPIERDNVAALPVSTFDHWWTRQINVKTRNMVRRAEKKGVEIREVPFDDTLVRAISAIYNESRLRQGKPFRHFGKDLETLRREHATFLERSVFLGAFLGDELIGFAKLVASDRQMGIMQIVSMIGHWDKAPTNALIADAVRCCAARGMSYLVYARFSERNKQRDSLSDFKKHNGFQRVDIPRYYVPLTLVGRAALRLGLHRGFVDHIPEPVLVKLRRIRSLWYSRKFQTAAF